MNIILSAYSCHPNRGSEPGVGWNWLVELSKYNQVYCLIDTSDGQEAAVIEALANLPQHKNVSLHFIRVPKIFEKINYKLKLEVWQIKAFFEARKITRKINISLIHHVTIATWWNCGYLWKLNIPFFLGPVSGGQKAPFATFVFLPFKAIIYECLRRLMIKASLTLRRSYRNAILTSRVIFAANGETRDLLKPIRNGKTIIMMNEIGVNYLPELGLSSRSSSDNLRLKILTVGKIIPRKNHNLLIDSLKLLNEEIDWQLKIVGDGNLKKQITKKVRQYHLEERIEFKGNVQFQDVDTYYRWADIFIFTSVRDATGTVVFEAMKFALPVIALDLHGARLVLKDGAGILIPVKNKVQIISDLKNAIVNLHKSPELRAKIGNKAREKIKENFLWEKRGAQMNSTYKEYIG